MVATIGEYKGHKTLNLKAGPDDQNGITFGVKKAKLILSHLEDIKRFASEQD